MIRKCLFGIALLVSAMGGTPTMAQDKGIDADYGSYTVLRDGQLEVWWPGYGYVTFGGPNLNGYENYCRMSDVVPFEYMAATLNNKTNRLGRARIVFDDCYAGLPTSVWHGRLCFDIPPYSEWNFEYDLCTYVSENRAAWRRDDVPRR